MNRDAFERSKDNKINDLFEIREQILNEIQNLQDELAGIDAKIELTESETYEEALADYRYEQWKANRGA